MITQDKPIETFCIIDKFDKNLNVEQGRKSMFTSHNSNRKHFRNCKRTTF